MTYRIYEVVQGDTVFRIEEDNPKVGSYLYVIENGKCVKDYLQSSIDLCKSLALEEYDIPIDIWNFIEED